MNGRKQDDSPMSDHERTVFAASVAMWSAVLFIGGLLLLGASPYAAWPLLVLGGFGLAQSILAGAGLVNHRPRPVPDERSGAAHLTGNSTRTRPTATVLTNAAQALLSSVSGAQLRPPSARRPFSLTAITDTRAAVPRYSWPETEDTVSPA